MIAALIAGPQPGIRDGRVWKMPPANVPPPVIAPRSTGLPRPVRSPVSDSPSEKAMLTPAPRPVAAPVKNAVSGSWVAVSRNDWLSVVTAEASAWVIVVMSSCFGGMEGMVGGPGFQTPDLEQDREGQHGREGPGEPGQDAHVAVPVIRPADSPLSHAEGRVLRYLPTKLSAPEIADELYLPVNTVKTRMRHLYDKLGAHRRHEAVEQARAPGLLAPSPRRPA
jgi:DNA-binding CsgD family transcriptional regulator